MLEPKEGLLTFRAEGNNDSSSQYFSRKIHWPALSSACNNEPSGVTIGRGYDLGSRSKNEILSTLLAAGLSKEQAEKLAKGSKLQGCHADNFVRSNKQDIGEITEPQQKQLFESLYREYSHLSESLYNNAKSRRNLINAVSWDKLDPILKDVLIDMRYQGALRGEMVSVFGKNNKDEVIKMIKNTPKLMQYEGSRGRIKYIKDNMR